MVTMTVQDAASATIEATLNYLQDTGVMPSVFTGGPGSTVIRAASPSDPHRVVMHNGRLKPDGFMLDREGFRFVRHDTKVVDFDDADELRRVYYPEMEALVKAETGAKRVVVFDHTLRTGDPAEQQARKVREPVLWAHNDYTEWSGPQRVREILPQEAEQLLQHRFAIIQVWRAIDRPIQSHPLALADASSVSSTDLLPAERRYPDRVGETYQLLYNSDHRWIYFPQMRRDEAVVFKVYDSQADGRARFTPHTSFIDPTTPPNAPPRQSIEVRTFAFFAPTER